MITGKTKVFFMIADPIDHVRTPEVLNPMFKARGIDAVMVPVHSDAESFAAAWRAMQRMQNLGGLVISVPLKNQALALADRRDPQAEKIGAANVVRREADGRMVATNLDGRGFLKGMMPEGAQGRAALLIGAGGAGRAIAVALADSGVRALRIFDLDQARAAALAQELAGHYPALPITAGPQNLAQVDLVINATPLGLHPESDPLPLDLRELRPEMIVADIVMKPAMTPLLTAAKALGCDIRLGAGMLDSQLELMLAHFGY